MLTCSTGQRSQSFPGSGLVDVAQGVRADADRKVLAAAPAGSRRARAAANNDDASCPRTVTRRPGLDASSPYQQNTPTCLTSSFCPLAMTTAFRPPTKAIVSAADLALWQTSPTHADVLAFITGLSTSVLDTPLSHPTPPSAAIEGLLSLLAEVEALVGEHPPQDHGTSRFGNPAFRPFLDAVRAASAGWLAAIEGVPDEAVCELKGYFDASWGDRERIDYGSGMELNFVCLLCVLPAARKLSASCDGSELTASADRPAPPLTRLCLSKLGVFKEEDRQALVLKVFWGCARCSCSSVWATRVLTPSCVDPTIQLHQGHAHPAENVLARTGRLARRLGPRRLPLPAVPLRRRSA